jgi:hypothetical protein
MTRVVRSLGKVPTEIDYEQQRQYSIRPVRARFRYWRDVPEGMLEWARQEELEGEWQDVLRSAQSCRACGRNRVR